MIFKFWIEIESFNLITLKDLSKEKELPLLEIQHITQLLDQVDSKEFILNDYLFLK